MRLLTKLVLAAALATVSTPAFAQKEIKYAAFGPPTTLTNHVITAWIEKVNAASENTIKIVQYQGGSLGNIQSIYKNTKDGVADAAWFLSELIPPNKFVKTSVINLPLVWEDLTVPQMSAVFWRLYERGLLKDEFDEMVPLAMTIIPPSDIRSKTPILKVEDLKGKRIRVSGTIAAEAVKQLGGVPTVIPTSDLYLALQRGAVDAVAVSPMGIQPFKLDEVTDNHLTIGIQASGALIAMNRTVWDALPAPAKKAFEANSGEVLSTDLGKAADRMVEEAFKAVRANPKQKINTLAPAELERWKKTVSPAIDEWKKTTPNGPAVYAALLEEIAKAKKN